MLKQLIQRLLDSRTTPSEASHSSYPDDGTVTQFSPSATSVSSWTKVVDSTIAPSDGYVIVRGKATGESYVQITAGDNPPHMERSTFAKATLNQYPILNLPIAKGKTFKVFAENTAEITVGLIKSIGGGYQTLKKLILQGGGLCCLKHSYSSLRRSSWLARRSGWLISRLIFLRPLQKLPSLLTENATPSQCLTRASWFCNVTASCLQDLTDLTWSISEREQTATSAFLFIPRKATLFLTRLANPTTSEPQTCTSIRLTVANNLSIGGVSC